MGELALTPEEEALWKDAMQRTLRQEPVDWTPQLVETARKLEARPRLSIEERIKAPLKDR